MKSFKIDENIFWVGGIDWSLRDFHGYTTERGSTYNSYLIIDEKITLIDTVKHYLFDEFLERIKDVVDPSKIDYIVVNHVEMDHSGSLPKILKIAKNAKIITNPQGEKGLKAHYGDDLNIKVIKTKDRLSIGKDNLIFFQTPMVHWPDNMVTYLENRKILFSNDAFGQHYSSFYRFDFENPLDEIIYQAKKYYANIVLPYSQQVQTALNLLKDLEIKIIAPSHGIVWKENVSDILKEYQNWSKDPSKKKVVIVYDTMWGSTEIMAKKYYEFFENEGYEVVFMPLKTNHISDIMTEILDSSIIGIGTPTLNKQPLPSVSGFLTYLLGLNPKNKKFLVFGSYGWGGEGTKIIKENLEKYSNRVFLEEKIQYIPKEENIENLKNNIKRSLS
ncbi:MAG: Rubredoxin-oxygen oxidoreductase [candidate division TA06 bacterium 32_111]|uniref:Rubredoxin-oxygen oxidoreductase n=2 Tax=Bacteria candidate phyla TaxID=1783234 RepID=A0A101I1R1_UNCT6|nr:MAG: Rubredoxin-oxygen oxidoreductase [candidate division TA06 bacterium 32_111]KUK87407.1 MAG: Rubredoxin-oxygen oxidoreductase [candidate division TA06 bacterium 34_109]HAF07759.1 MBL fold metallo-hydrolase [candidate division WOR-3 bacterium]HCP17277.1 MBL fold metallo-hydrolase [candidate division WOR-3 bacterium]